MSSAGNALVVDTLEPWAPPKQVFTENCVSAKACELFPILPLFYTDKLRECPRFPMKTALLLSAC